MKIRAAVLSETVVGDPMFSWGTIQENPGLHPQCLIVLLQGSSRGTGEAYEADQEDEEHEEGKED